MNSLLERIFNLKSAQTTVKVESIAGMTTFLTMVYIIFVNPALLSQIGMDRDAVFIATCLAATLGCFIMGFWANLPIAQAPGMGLNAFFTYSVVLGEGYSWQTALAAVFISGVIFIFLSLFKIREWVINAIPVALKVGIASGIGIFLAFIALKNANIIASHPATFLTAGDLTSIPAILGTLSFFITIGLVYKGYKSAVILSVFAVTILALIIGDVQYNGVIAIPTSIAPTYMKMDFTGMFEVGFIAIVFAFLFVDLFDTAGTLIAVSEKAGLRDKKTGKIPRLNRALLADSTATTVGAVLGTSNTTSYIESVSGVAVGGRTGLTAVVVGLLFLVATFFSPLAGTVPAYATSGALLYVAILMLSGLTQIDWSDITESAPVAMICFIMPLTFSIVDGIALGFISYAGIKLVTGKFKEVPVSVWFLAALFIFKIILTS